MRVRSPIVENNFADARIMQFTESALVRGRCEEFAQKMRAKVQQSNVIVSLEGVLRMDAAGISTLVGLYSEALRAGHSFHVVKPSRNVKALLGVFKLDALLLYHDVNLESQSGAFENSHAA